MAEADDDLPARMQTTSPDPQIPSTTVTNTEGEIPTTSRPSTPLSDNVPSSHMPTHAGFDLNAIKNVLQEVEQEPSKSQALAPAPSKNFFSKLSSPPIAAPLRRPESTPLSNQPIEDVVSGITARSGSRDEILFSRSVSVNLPTWKDEEDEEAYNPPVDTNPKTLFATSSSNFEDNLPYISHTSRLRPDDSITLSDDIIPSWGASSNPLNTASLSNHPQYDRSVPSPPVMLNPFASSSSGPLTFGSLDGSMNSGLGGLQADPWSIPASAKKKVTLDNYSSNSPWS